VSVSSSPYGPPPDQEPASPILPPHIEQTVQAIAKLHADHHRRATPLQLIVDRMTALVARPAFVACVTLAVIAWIGGNLAMQKLTGHSLDRPAFPLLQGFAELITIYITTLVLMSQRRKDQLSELREQLTLELAITTELKSAKLIALMEEMRRDNPLLDNRIDEQAEAMAQPADPEAVLEALQDTQDEMIAAAAEPQAKAEPAG
jgi:uncharacterized membrane protein